MADTMGIAPTTQERKSYWDKLIGDGDIPVEELQSLAVNNSECQMMDVYNHITASNHLSNVHSGAAEFQSDAYMEYRRRVFEQLAAEYERESRQQEKQKHIEQTENDANLPSSTFLHPSNEDLMKSSSDQQPCWDNSDLQDQTYSLSPSHEFVSNTLPWQKSRGSLPDQQVRTLNPENVSKSENELHCDHRKPKPLMNWASIDEQIKLKSSKTKSNESIRSGSDLTSPSTLRRWRSKKNSFQKQKLEREAIRRKLSMGEDDDDDLELDKSRSRYERSFSANSQTLHICYINQSCSSDESEEDTSSNKSHTTTPLLFSPTTSPGFMSPRGYGRQYRSRVSDSSSHSSSSSVNAGSENTIIKHSHRQDFRAPRTKQQELEMEARFELAQAHRKAKQQAEEERKTKRIQDKSSLAHRLLSVTLSDETYAKIKSYSLSRRDCRLMTSGQLQLILNDMHTKKQVLNEELMALLITRDQLQTEQDAKLVDIEDAKTMMNSVGPETTV